MKRQFIIRYIKSNLLHQRIIKFCLVGGSGILVNMGLLYILTEYVGIYYIVSSIIAIEISLIINFLLNDIWTWRDRGKKRFSERVIKYHVSAGATALFANWFLLFFLTELFGFYYLISNLIGIAVGTLSNFILNDLWTFNQVDKN